MNQAPIKEESWETSKRGMDYFSKVVVLYR